jgi:hypothetical protein
MKVALIPSEDAGTCTGCDKQAVLKSETGEWCTVHLPLADVPNEQMDEVVHWIVLMDDMFQIDGDGNIRLVENG